MKANPEDRRSPALPEGSLVAGRYELGPLLAETETGALHRARDRVRGAGVTLKVIGRALLGGEEPDERFNESAGLMLRLSHPGIARVLDVGEDRERGLFVVAMEPLPGVPLRLWLEAKRQAREAVSAREALEIASGILEALRYAHGLTSRHGGLTPDAVLVLAAVPGPAGGPGVKVLDFGIARLATSRFVDYLAPEQRVEGAAVGGRADLYSVAVLLYEMLTGTLPTGLFGAPSEERPDLPSELDPIVLRGLRRSAEERFASAADFLDAIAAVRPLVEKSAPEAAPKAADRPTAPMATVPSAAAPPAPAAPAAAAPAAEAPSAPAAEADRSPAAEAERSPAAEASGRRRETLLLALGVAGGLLVAAAGFSIYRAIAPPPATRSAAEAPRAVEVPRVVEAPPAAEAPRTAETPAAAEAPPAAEAAPAAEAPDRRPPAIALEPLPEETDEREIVIAGTLDEDGCRVAVNGAPAIVSGRRFEAAVALARGANAIAVTASDGPGNEARASAAVRLALPEPTFRSEGRIEVSGKHALVVASEREHETAERLSRLGDEALEFTAAELGVPLPAGPYRTFLYRTIPEYEKAEEALTRGAYRDALSMVYAPSGDALLALQPRPERPSGEEGMLEALFVENLCAALLGRLHPRLGDWPVWLADGLAGAWSGRFMAEAGGATAERSPWTASFIHDMREALDEGRFVPIEALLAAPASSEGSRLRYAEAAALVRLLDSPRPENAGRRGRFRAFLGEAGALSRGPNLRERVNAKFREAFGDLAALEQELEASVRAERAFPWHVLLRELRARADGSLVAESFPKCACLALSAGPPLEGPASIKAEIEVAQLGARQVHLVFGHARERSHLLAFGPGFIALLRFDGHWKPVARATVDPALFVAPKHTIEAEIGRERLIGRLDGATLFAYKLKESIPPGRFGIGCQDSRVVFRSVAAAPIGAEAPEPAGD